jgi:hypothetical protein
MPLRPFKYDIGTEEREDIFEEAQEEQGVDKSAKIPEVEVMLPSAPETAGATGLSDLNLIQRKIDSKLTPYQQLMKAISSGEKERVAEILVRYCGPPAHRRKKTIRARDGTMIVDTNAKSLPPLPNSVLHAISSNPQVEVSTKSLYEARDHTNRTILMLAAQSGKYGVVSCILHYNPDVNASTE